MPGPSLLAGRNQAELSPADIRRAINTFLGMEPTVNVRFDPASNTVFRVNHEENGDEYGEIVVGADIYPGAGIVDPNSALSLDAAAAHELCHYYRWRDRRHLLEAQFENLDEALTSLEAVLRYERHLNSQDIKQLIQDAMQRMNLFHRDIQGA